MSGSTDRYRWCRHAVVGEKAARAVYGGRDSRCDRLMDRERTRAAMVRGAWLVWFPVLLSLSLIAFAFTLSPSHFLLLDGAMPLFLYITFSVAVVVKAAAGMGRLGVHLGWASRGLWSAQNGKSVSHRMNLGGIES